jgi:hypothetical protein
MKKAVGAALAALLIVVSAVFVASAATKKPGAKPAGASPRTMTLACAEEIYNVKGGLSYVSRASQCDGPGQELVRFRQNSIYACRKEHGTLRSRRAKEGARSRGPAGFMRKVDAPSRCQPDTQPNETPVELPRRRDTLFCVARSSQELRWVTRVRDCIDTEFPVRLKRFRGNRPPHGGGAANRVPTANADGALTDEGSSRSIAVLANDTDGDGDPLTVANLDTTGTKGTVAVNPDNTVSYDPNGQFEGLKTGEMANDTFTYRADDGEDTSDPATVTVTVTGQNDAPTAHDDSSSTEETAAKTIPVLSNDTDPDNDPLKVGAVDTTGTQGTVTITNGGADVQYDPNGQFSGLQSGDTATDTFKYKVNDGTSDSTLDATVTVTVTGDNEPPVLANPGSLNYTENDPNTQLTSTLTATDADDTNLEGAALQVTTGFDAGDVLDFNDQLGITGSYNSGTGILTLTGTASVSDYQTALRDVKFRSTNDNPTTSKSVQIEANDGSEDSAPQFVTINVTRVNDAPVVNLRDSNLTYTEDSGPQAIDSAITSITDPESDSLSGASVEVAGADWVPAQDDLAWVDNNGGDGISLGTDDDANGTLTLTGTGTIAEYKAALEAVTYASNSNDPQGDRDVSVEVTDVPGATSTPDSRKIVFSNSNDAPVLANPGTGSYIENDPATAITSTITASDDDDTHLESAQVKIAAGLEATDELSFTDQSGITGGTYNSGTGVLTLTGNATKSDYQTALRDVKFRSTSDNPGTSRTIEFTANDGTADSAALNVPLTITPTNDAPAIDLTDTALEYDEGDGPVAIDAAADITDIEGDQMSGASVDAGASWEPGQDELAFNDTDGIGGINLGVDDDANGTLTLTGNGTIAQYEAAIAQIFYSNNSDDPDTTPRVLTATVTDVPGATSGPDTRNINVNKVNDAPLLSNAGNGSYTENDPATQISSTLTVADIDDTHLESAVVQITTGREATDELSFTDQSGITGGTYNSGTGVLTLTGNATKSDYQTALRDVKFRSTSDNPATAKRVEWTVNDGSLDSNTTFTDVTVTRTNDTPTINLTNTALEYDEGDGPVSIDTAVTITDIESDQIGGASVDVGASWEPGQDDLAFNDTDGAGGINLGTDDDANGTLTLTGNGTIAQYQAAIAQIFYTNNSDDPDETARVLTATVTDVPGATSAPDTRTINVNKVNDAPLLSNAGNGSYTENDPATDVTSTITVSDIDDTHLESAVVQITTGREATDELSFTDQSGITGGTYNSGTGVLTLTGNATKSDWEAALRDVKFRSTSDNPATAKRVEWTVNDGSLDSNTTFTDVTVTRTNDAPTINLTNTALEYDEGDGPVAIDDSVTITDAESDQIGGASVDVGASWEPGQDDLAFNDTDGAGGINLGTDDDANGTLTLTGNGTIAQYQAAIAQIFYTNNSDDPDETARVLSATVTDVPGATSGPDTRNINVNKVNDAPLLSNGGTLNYTENDPATQISSTLTVADIDDTQLVSGSVAITTGHESDDDLSWTDNDAGDGITLGTDDNTNDVISLTGTGTLDEYRDALRAVKYENTGNNPTGPKQATFKANDGDVDSNNAIADINITGQNDAPTVNLTDANLTYNEGAGAIAIDTAATINDADSNVINRLTIDLSNWQSGQDELAWTDNNGSDAITLTTDDDTNGQIVLEGDGTEAEYEAALDAVTYENNSQNPSPATRVASVKARDGANAEGPADTRTIDVNSINDVPSLTTGDTLNYTEGDPAATIDSTITITDDDDTNMDNATVSVTTGHETVDDLDWVDNNGADGITLGSDDNGTDVLTLTGSGTLAEYEAALEAVTFRSDSNNPPTSKQIDLKVNDGDNDSNTAIVPVNVTNVNDQPTVDATNAALVYTENDPATAVDSGLTVTDTDGNDLSGGSASITANYQAGQDFLNWTDNNLADSITLDNINSSAQTIVLTGIDSPANYQAALRAVTYQNGSEAPEAIADRTVTFSATDVPGLTGSDTRTIDVVSVDDPPVAMNDSATVSEDDAATSIPVLTNDTDVDAGPKTISSATDPANGTVVLTGGSPGAHTGLTYQPDPNYCNDPPGNAPDTFQYTLNGGSNATVSMTVTCVNDAPVATDESFNATNSAVGNTTLNVNNTATRNATTDGRPATPDPTDTSPTTDRPHKEITGDIMANDTDVDNNNNQFTVTPGTFATNDGGTVTIQSDGDFNFEPAPSTSCTDTSDFFDYTVTDNDSLDPKTDTGRVTVAITGCVWYVNNNDAQGNNGTSEKPFDTTAQAQTASGNNHTTFVYDGDDTTTGYNTGFTMNSGESLLSEGAALVIGSDTLHTADAANKASLTNNNADVVTLAGSATVKSFNIDPQGTGGGIFGTGLGATTITLDDLNVVDNGTKGTQPGLELDTNTGTTTNVSNLTVNNGDGSSATTGDTGVKLNATGTVNFASTGTIAITTNGGAGLDAAAGAGTTSLGSASTFDGITVTNSGTGGVKLANTTGSGTAFGDGSGNDLQLTTVSGSPAAFSVQTAGSFSVPSAGQSDVSATGGPAIDVVSSTGSTMPLDSVSSTNSANDGINIDSIGTGTFSATSGSIGGYAGIGFDINSGSGAITYPGAFANGSGPLVSEVTGRTGGVISLSGSMTDNNDAGGGINFSGNTGGSTVFSGATKQFNTGASDALTVSNPDGGNHTAVWSGGGTDVDTTSGNGVNVNGVGGTADGTVQFSGSGNTVDSTALSASNRALNISHVNIAAADATFDRVSSNGGANGVLLNNTGANGNLAITGTGGTCTAANTTGCSGGVVQNTVGGDDSGLTPIGAGIVLNNTRDVSLTRLHVHDHSNYGIRGNDVTGFTLNTTVVNGTNGTNINSPFNDSSISFDNLNGSAAVTDSDISGGAQHGMAVNNAAGALDRITIDNSTFATQQAGGGDALQLESIPGAGVLKATIQNDSDFTSAAGDLFDFQHNGSGTGDLVVTNSDFQNTLPHAQQAAGGGGLSTSSGSDMTMSFTGNELSGANGPALTLVRTAQVTPHTLTGTFNSNTIGVAGTVDSGSKAGSGLKMQNSGGGGTLNMTANANQIHQYDESAIEIVAGNGNTTNTGTTNVTLDGNVVQNPGSGAGDLKHGIHINAGTGGVGSNDDQDVCVDATNNNIATSGKDSVPASGVTDPVSGAPNLDFNLRARGISTVRLPGYGGSSTDLTAVRNFFVSQNSVGGAPDGLVRRDAGAAYSGTGTNCP